MRHPLPHTAAGILAVTLTLTACAGSTAAVDPGSAPSNGASATAEVVSDPDDVADAVARTFWAADISTDTTPTDAAHRATQWLTPAYAAIATEPLPGGAGADWLELADHHGHETVTTDLADDIVPDRPADTTTTATRVRIVTLTLTGTDGWIGQPQHLIATLTLTRDNDTRPWLVNNITVDQPLTGTPDGTESDFD